MHLGGVLCGRAVYCVSGWCTVCLGGVLCGRAVYWLIRRCTMW